MITDKITVVMITYLPKVRKEVGMTIYEHDFKTYIKLPRHIPKYQTHRKEETFPKRLIKLLFIKVRCLINVNV